ncbi:hypothetical protein [Flavobacterium microcysteis]
MDTYKIILEAHSGIAYVALLTIGVAAINSLIGLSAKNEFKPKDRRIALFGLIAAHLQFVFGLILYFVSPKGVALFKQAGMKEIMGNSELRMMAVEHPFVNILAIILITIGWSTHKRIEGSDKKFKKIAIFYSLGFLLLVSRIPWNVWFS